MSYEFIFDKKAIKFLEKLPENIRKRIFKKLRSTKTSPFYFFEGLHEIKACELRIGKYRVIADIDKQEN